MFTVDRDHDSVNPYGRLVASNVRFVGSLPPGGINLRLVCSALPLRWGEQRRSLGRAPKQDLDWCQRLAHLDRLSAACRFPSVAFRELEPMQPPAGVASDQQGAVGVGHQGGDDGIGDEEDTGGAIGVGRIP